MAWAPSLRSLIAALLLLQIGGCGQPTADRETAEVTRPVKIKTIETSSNRRMLTFPAVVRASETAELTFQIAGQIQELNVLEGEDVAEGFVIAKLDQRNARNALAQATAEFQNAEAEFQRARRLFDRDAVAKSTLDTRKTQRDISRVALSNAQKALDDTVISAPFDGGISRVYPQRFQNIQAKEPIVVIQSNRVEAVINIPGTIVARIPRLEPVGVTVELDAAPGVKIPATFREASGIADQSTQTYEVAFDFVAPENLLILPGMTATVSSTFIFNDMDDIVPEGVSAPLSSILAEGDQTFVWRINEEAMTISKIEVTVQATNGEDVVVTEGLETGDQIVEAGVSFLYEGMSIRPWTPE